MLRRQRLTQRCTDEYEPVNPHSATSRSYTRVAVWRCLTGMRRSAVSHPSTTYRIPRVDHRPARMPRAKGLGRVIPVVGVPGHGRARYAEFPRYLPVAQALAVELPDTPSDTHRCRHFLSSREPSVWLTGTRESTKEPHDAGVLIPPAPSPPTPSKLNAQGVQEQVPTVNTFIRSHTPDQRHPGAFRTHARADGRAPEQRTAYHPRRRARSNAATAP